MHEAVPKLSMQIVDIILATLYTLKDSHKQFLRNNTHWPVRVCIKTRCDRDNVIFRSYYATD